MQTRPHHARPLLVHRPLEQLPGAADTLSTQFTVPLIINSFRTAYYVQWGLLMAATAVAILPVVVLYLLAQRYFVEGIAIRTQGHGCENGRGRGLLELRKEVEVRKIYRPT